MDLVTAVRTVAAGGILVTPSIREKLRKLQFDGQVIAQLSRREREVIKLIALGNSSKESKDHAHQSPYRGHLP